MFPPVAAGVLATTFYHIFALVLPLAIARSVFAGGLLGYIIYDLMHYYLHHGSPTPGSYLHQLKRYHVSHHFEDQQKGVYSLLNILFECANKQTSVNDKAQNIFQILLCCPRKNPYTLPPTPTEFFFV